MATPTDIEHLEGIGEYRCGFSAPDTAVYKSSKGLKEEVVRKISAMKQEPQWMLDFRLKALEHFLARPMPAWGGDLSRLDLDNIYYYVRPADMESKSWEDVPDAIKQTFDRIGIPQAAAKFLARGGPP